MISVEELFVSDNKYPKWISSNPVFSKLGYVRKVFPEIGLSDFEEKIVIDNSSEITSSANQLLDVITDFLNARTTKLLTFSKKAKIGKKRRRHLNSLLSIMTTLMDWLRTNKKSFITILPTGKVSLNIPNDLYAKDVLFLKKGASLFKIYDKLNLLLKEGKFVSLKDISQAFQFKNFSSINIPSKEMFVKFSSAQVEGLWDIATMSMRGITSCQTWSTGSSNDGRVIGSMIDPFTAIIYLTCGGTFNTYGSKMIRRCVVRYVIDNNNKTPYLLLEKMYPAFEKPSLDAFIRVIKAGAPAGMEVYYTVDVGEKAHRQGTKLSYSYVPLSDEIKALDPKFYPYCDSALLFREDLTCAFAKNTQALRFIFKRRVPKLFEQALQSGAFKQVNIKSFGAGTARLIAQLRRSNLKTKMGLMGDPSATKFDLEVDSSDNVGNENHSLNELGSKFAEFVCNLSTDNDPLGYLTNNRKECAAFFISEFGTTISVEFADFLISNIVEYIVQKNSLK